MIAMGLRSRLLLTAGFDDILKNWTNDEIMGEPDAQFVDRITEFRPIRFGRNPNRVGAALTWLYLVVLIQDKFSTDPLLFGLD